MYQLFLDTTNQYLTVLVLKDDQEITSISLESWQKQTELAVETIKQQLLKAKIKLIDILQVVVANGPGSYTGIRVGITFVKILKTLNPHITIYVINSLLLQAGLKKAISIFSAYNNKSYLSVFDNGRVIIKPQLVSEVAKAGIISDLPNFILIQDQKNCNIIENFKLLKPYFVKIEKIADLQPVYINDPFTKL